MNHLVAQIWTMGSLAPDPPTPLSLISGETEIDEDVGKIGFTADVAMRLAAERPPEAKSNVTVIHPGDASNQGLADSA